MWHEARRIGRKTRGMLVDYRKRAERRRDFYERIKADPTQFLQIHGRRCKIYLDQNIGTENVAMMPWKGQRDNIIDRFDVRAHLDSIHEDEESKNEEPLTQEERHINYERYRILGQNSFLKIPEEKFLKQIHLDEQYGFGNSDIRQKKDSRMGVSIGFNYEENIVIDQECVENSADETSDNDLDVDLMINVTKLDTTEANEMNKHGCLFGMDSNDFYSFLINDLEEEEALKLAQEEEQERAFFSGRKSRRERRYHRDKKLANRIISSPSYAAKSSPVVAKICDSQSSRSRSSSPEFSEKITYITSFADDEEPSTSKGNDISSKKQVSSHIRRSRSRRRNSKVRYRRSTSTTSSFTSTSSSSSRSSLRKYRKRRYPSTCTSTSASDCTSSSEKDNTLSREHLKVVPRYYGRKKSNTSTDSTDMELSQKEYLAHNNKLLKKSSTTSIIDRLKKRRQILINKQLKADKLAAQIKTNKEKMEQQNRENELKQMSIKLRKRQREKRHANNLESSFSDSEYSSKSDSSKIEKRKYHRSRSKKISKKTNDKSINRNRQNNKKDRFESGDCVSRSAPKLVNY